MKSNTPSVKPQILDPHLQEVIRIARQELSDLQRQRTEIVRRIGTAKQTILGLANLFGDPALHSEILQLMENGASSRKPGFTRACRLILLEAGRSLNSREICQRFWDQHRELATRHKDLLASVTTVLNRLVAYGEVRATEDLQGRRLWEWVADEPVAVANLATPERATSNEVTLG